MKLRIIKAGMLLALLSLFSFTGQAAAQTTIVLGAGTCEAAPINGSWDGADTCSITEKGFITAGDTLENS